MAGCPSIHIERPSPQAKHHQRPNLGATRSRNYLPCVTRTVTSGFVMWSLLIKERPAYGEQELIRRHIPSFQAFDECLCFLLDLAT